MNNPLKVEEVIDSGPADTESLPPGAFHLEDLLAVEPPPTDEELSAKLQEIDDAENNRTELVVTYDLTLDRSRKATQSRKNLGVNVVRVHGEYKAQHVNHVRDGAPKPDRSELDSLLKEDLELQDLEESFKSILAEQRLEIEEENKAIRRLKDELRAMKIAQNEWQGKSRVKKFMEEFRPIAAEAAGLHARWVLDFIGNSVLKVGLRLGGSPTNRDLFHSLRSPGRNDAPMRAMTEEVAAFYRPDNVDLENAG